MLRLSLVGDIMCEPLLLKSAYRKDGSYDFSGVFRQIRDLFAESDYVVGNLETPLAGKGAGYVSGLFSFNAPDEFAKAIKEAGISFVSTANNHCMDRGIDGLKRTVRALDEIGLSHDGTQEMQAEKDPFIVNVKDTSIAIIPYTYGTNFGMHHNALQEDGYVNLLHADTDPVYITGKKGRLSRVKQAVFKGLKREQLVAIKKMLGMTYNSPRKDDYLDEEEAKPYFDKLSEKIGIAKDKADIVVFYPHVGGQFNIVPGKFTEYTMKRALEMGADAIIASHPHIVQKAEMVQGVPVFYSIGNFSMSPNSVYLLHEHLPEYGLVIHLYIQNRRIEKTTFSIIKIIEEKGKMLTVWPINKLAAPKEAEIRQIYKTVTGADLSGEIIRSEYTLEGTIEHI